MKKTISIKFQISSSNNKQDGRRISYKIDILTFWIPENDVSLRGRRKTEQQKFNMIGWFQASGNFILFDQHQLYILSIITMIGLFLQSVFILSVTFIGRGIYSANFETSKVIVHKPSYSENSHFGFTVAGYKVEKDSWLDELYKFFKKSSNSFLFQNHILSYKCL